MTARELRQLFKNNSDCYADTGRFEDDGSFTLGKVVQAMTEDVFVGLMEEYAKQQGGIVKQVIDQLCQVPNTELIQALDTLLDTTKALIASKRVVNLDESIAYYEKLIKQYNQ